MKILFLTGASGTGKSTIAHLLAKDDRYNLIKSYTDRPMRDNEYDHIFLSKKELSDLISLGTVSAYTEIDGYRYCSLCEQFDPDKINVYVVDVHGINSTLDSFSTVDFLSVLITRKKVDIDQIRKNRNIDIPSRTQVNFTVANDDNSPSSVVGVIKFLTLYDNGVFFNKAYSRVISISQEIELLEHHAQQMWNRAQKLREELNVHT